MIHHVNKWFLVCNGSPQLPTFTTANQSDSEIQLCTRGDFGFAEFCRGRVSLPKMEYTKPRGRTHGCAPTQDINRCDWYFRVGAGPRACPDLYGNIMMMGNHRGLPLRYHLVNFHKSGFYNKEILYISVGAGLPWPKWNTRNQKGAGTAPLRRASYDVNVCFRVGTDPCVCPHSFGNIIKMGNHRGLPLRNRLINISFMGIIK